MPPDFDTAYRAMSTRDTRFDGHFIAAVTSTGIYCRPGCPSRTPKPGNVRFFATPAAAQAAGFRACRRCLPDAAPGSPEWNARADVVGAAMRLIGDGVVDREGVPGLARRLGYSPRHLGRLLTAEVGAPPLALARATRADTARLLLTATDLPISEIAFAAGFASIRQFDDTIGQIFAMSPTQLRGLRGRPAGGGRITIRLAVRTPFDGAALLRFLSARAIPGVEAADGATYSRTLRLPTGTGTVALTMPTDPAASAEPGRSFVTATLALEHVADLAPAVARCRRLLDADADPVGIAAVLATDPALAAVVASAPGLRVPGATGGPEILIRALVGQQVSVAAARTALAKLTAAADERVTSDNPALTHLFPSPARIAAIGPDGIGGPRRRAAAIALAATDLAAGSLVVDSGRQRGDLAAELVARAGIGPWTAGYVAMRVLGDPDVLLTGDLALRGGAAVLGLPDRPRELTDYAERWRPFRSYAGMYLWRSCPPPVRARRPDAQRRANTQRRPDAQHGDTRRGPASAPAGPSSKGQP